MGQLVEIDGDTAPLRDVDHVEHQHHRPAGALQLKHEAEGEAQIGGVGDAQHEIRNGFIPVAAEHDVAGDLFVRAAAPQGNRCPAGRAGSRCGRPA